MRPFAIVALLAACAPATKTVSIDYPVMTLGEADLEFGTVDRGATATQTLTLSNAGGMDMGVGEIVVGDDETQFTVVWDRGDVDCGAEADAKDTGGTAGGDTGDTGEPPDDADGPLLLGPGCSLPLSVTFAPTAGGDVWGALRVTSVQADATTEGDPPRYARDPVRFEQVVYLHGTTDHANGPRLVVSPRSWDFGAVHPDSPDDAEPARLTLTNVGDADLTLADVTLDEATCGDAFELLARFPQGTVLPPEATTLVEVAFVPADDDAVYCRLDVASDDPEDPVVDVTLEGNTGTDADNESPTVAIRSPEPGLRYDPWDVVTVELNLFDVDQAAETLACEVESEARGAIVADCAAGDPSGHVFVDVAADDLVAGPDTLTVTVTDVAGETDVATVSVLVDAAWPEDDEDGDAYSPTTDPVDCDEADVGTYPFAAETWDGADNDCDGEIDEGTEGADDDGDGFAELDGDCDDGEADTYPDAAERGDGADNDCDATTDEGTSLYDDDGDGFAEIDEDCDDGDASVSPASVEACGDGVDNDCDGLRDDRDACIGGDTAPVLVGDLLRASQVACLPGDEVDLDAVVFDADGDTPSWQWQDDMGGAFDSTVVARVRYTCPTPPAGGGNATIYATVTDPDGSSDWTFERIAVYDEGTPLYEPYTRVETVE
ncbi:MAG: MopE-related protein [Myxococcota bacterium]